MTVTNRNHHYLLLLVIWALTYLPALGERALKNWDEAIYATSARYMVEHGDWLMPHHSWGNDGFTPFLQKPPLMEWMMGVSMDLFGFNTFAVRLPSVILGLCAILLCYSIGREILDWRAGLASGLVLLVTPAWWAPTYSARSAEFDAGLIFFGSVFVYALLWHRDKRNWAIIAGVAAAAAFLTKGFAAGAFLFVVAPFVIGDVRSWLTREVFAGGVVALVLSLPWTLYAYLTEREEFLNSFVLRQVRRSSGELAGNSGLLPTSNYPYFQTLFTSQYITPTVITGICGALAWTRLGSERESLKKLSWWALSPVIFYSLVGGTHGWYIKPIIIPLAILSGVGVAYVHTWWNQTTSPNIEISPRTFIVIGVVIALLLPVAYSVLLTPPTTTAQQTLGKQVPAEMPDEGVYSNIEHGNPPFVFEFYSGRPVIRADMDTIHSQRPPYLLLYTDTEPPDGYEQVAEDGGLMVLMRN